MRKVKINSAYITLGQMLKLTDCIDSGGQVKSFLSEVCVWVNGEIDQRRGRKLYPGDLVDVENMGTFLID